MATVKSISRHRRMPSLRGKFMVDVYRGLIRVRAWPKRRGPPKSAAQRYWVDWFKQANLLAKYVDAATARRAIDLTKGTGMYPRDIILSAMRGRLYWITDKNGKKWFPMAAIQDISETLDILAQTIGDVLVRATDRWRAAGPALPTIGDALTYQGPAAPPIWAAAGAGASIQNLPATPIIPDGTQNQYDIDVSSFPEFEITLDAVGFTGADRAWVRFSTDGGASFRAGAADYLLTSISPTVAVRYNSTAMRLEAGTAVSGHYAVSRFSSMFLNRAQYTADVSPAAGVVTHVSGIAQFAGPITDIRILSQGGNNFNAGAIYVVGLLGA